MEKIKNLCEVDPLDLAVVERVFGQRIETTTGAVLILKSADVPPNDSGIEPSGELPRWCNVLEGMSDDDLAEFNSTLEQPVHLARSIATDGS
ncbi:MAG: hypothetical protein WDZ48_04345 [Pirellulales bacterium]